MALARSGLSLLLSSWPTNSELTGSSPAAGAASTSPEPPEAAASNAVVLTVIICEESLLDEFFLQGFPKFRLHFVFGTFLFLQVLTFASIVYYFSHFCMEFQNCGYHVANFLNLLKHPPTFSFSKSFVQEKCQKLSVYGFLGHPLFPPSSASP